MVRSRRRAGPGLAGGIAAGLVIAASLAGCTPQPTPAPVTVTATVVAPEPNPTVSVAPPQTTEAPPPPEAAPQPEPVPNAPAPEVVEGPAVDNGARTGATGFPVYDENHAIVSYAVVEGDSFFDIAQRFDISQQRLLRMNPQIPDFGESIYVGQVINLDWTKAGVG